MVMVIRVPAFFTYKLQHWPVGVYGYGYAYFLRAGDYVHMCVCLYYYVLHPLASLGWGAC